MITEVEFAKYCTALDNEEIYELFDEIIPNWLRDDILRTHADKASAEPVRSALNALGAKYNIQSLKNY